MLAAPEQRDCAELAMHGLASPARSPYTATMPQEVQPGCFSLRFSALARVLCLDRQMDSNDLTRERAAYLWMSLVRWLPSPQAAEALAACDLPTVRILARNLRSVMIMPCQPRVEPMAA